jgi:phosphoribosylformylglycinamidine synthase II
MIHTIRVRTTNGPDLLGKEILQEIRTHLKNEAVRDIKTTKVYRLEGITAKEAKKLAEVALSEQVNQIYTLNRPLLNGTRNIIEVAYKPGVMNPEVDSIVKTAKDLGITPIAADSSHEYAFYGKLSKKTLLNIAAKIQLLNPTIEHVITKEPETLLIQGDLGKTDIIPLRSASDKELVELSKDTLFLNLSEMQAIQKYFRGINRDPTDCELEVLAQTWSEHCVHKTFKADLIIDGKKKNSLFSRIKNTAKGHDDLIVSAFVDNSGVIDFYDGYAICGKVETHNSPSAIEPYGGAMTGSGGVIRDVLGTGQGAKVLMASDVFCFAPPHLSKKEIPPGCLHPEYLLKKVVAGVRDYGNRVGIPTANGSIHFHSDFKAKPTVAVGAFGIIAKNRAVKKSPKIGDLLLTMGGRTGRDGIHGATFSSGEMTNRTTNVSGSAVQIGNAIEEKRIIDAIQELSEKHLLRAITDCGAGGFSSAIGEMAENLGVKVFLEKAPLKYADINPWEIFLSESQERMVIAIDPKNLTDTLAVCKLFNVEAAVIGEIDGSQRLQVYHGKSMVCDMDMDFLHNGLPKRTMIGTTKRSQIKEKKPEKAKDLGAIWKKILGHGNVASKEAIVRQYDHTVQGKSALAPFSGTELDGPNDGAIIRPFYNKPYGLVIAHGLNPEFMRLDPYWGGIWAITEAISNYVAIGGDTKSAALIDNFIWPFPDESSLADLDAAVDACVKMADLLDIPYVSGKDSLSSTYRYPNGDVLKIPPVLLISVFGKIPDVTKTTSSDLKKPGSTLVLLGNPDILNLGGTTYFSVTKSTSKLGPKVDIATLPDTLSTLARVIQKGNILSAHDVSEGGIAATLAEMAIGGNMGANIDLEKIARKTRPDYIFFNETAGTFLVEVTDDKAARNLFHNVPYKIIGNTTDKPNISVTYGKKIIANEKISSLKIAWQKPMKDIFS